MRVPDAAVTPAVRIGRARLEVARAAFEIAFGSGEEARRLLSRALDSYAAASPSGSEDQRDAVELGLALEIRTGLRLPHDERRLPGAGGDSTPRPSRTSATDATRSAPRCGATSAGTGWSRAREGSTATALAADL